jgi:hypothetical protein
MRSFRIYSLTFAVMVCGLVAAGTRASADQTPPAGGRQGGAPLVNIKVHPKDITRQQLTVLMRGYAAALGVQCTHCHVEDMSQRSSDDKPAKLIARKMIEMTDTINTKHLDGIKDPAPAGSPKVTCYTCHRGQLKPDTKAPAGH